MTMPEETTQVYSLEARLADILKIYPVERGSLWFAVESVWQEANPDYALIRNTRRYGHFGLVTSTLSAPQPTVVPLCHGHSQAHKSERWFHLRATGLNSRERERDSWFDIWHRFPVAWTEFFDAAIERNLDKPVLNPAEAQQLASIENRIKAKTQSDFERARELYQRHPAWRQHFPEQQGPGA